MINPGGTGKPKFFSWTMLIPLLPSWMMPVTRLRAESMGVIAFLGSYISSFWSLSLGSLFDCWKRVVRMRLKKKSNCWSPRDKAICSRKKISDTRYCNFSRSSRYSLGKNFGSIRSMGIWERIRLRFWPWILWKLSWMMFFTAWANPLKMSRYWVWVKPFTSSEWAKNSSWRSNSTEEIPSRFKALSNSLNRL